MCHECPYQRDPDVFLLAKLFLGGLGRQGLKTTRFLNICGSLALAPQASNKTLGPKNTSGSLWPFEVVPGKCGETDPSTRKHPEGLRGIGPTPGCFPESTLSYPSCAYGQREITNKNGPRIRAGRGPKPMISLGKRQSGRSPGTPRGRGSQDKNGKCS